MKKVVDELGYEVITDTVNLQISGITCASCVEHIQKAVGDLPGVSKVVVNLATGTARVDYIASVTPLSEIRKVIKELGYADSERARLEGQEALDREREARPRAITRQRRNLIIP